MLPSIRSLIDRFPGRPQAAALRAAAEPAHAPYCTAAETSFCVDPDKGVRPCCTFGGMVGNLKETPLAEILSGERWTAIKDQIRRGETPVGCDNCRRREKSTGWSVRKGQFDPASERNANWSKGLTQIELNTSNVCNLACTHCSSHFSSRWVEISSKTSKELHYHHTGRTASIHSPDPDNLVAQLAELDLSHLEIVRFKGGEPMLNRDVPAVLEHLRERGFLHNVEVQFVSNGSSINQKVLELLGHCRNVILCISVDGVGALQGYIRRGPSDNERIEAFMDAFSTLDRIWFTVSVSVMTYNIFRLDQISAWWNGLAKRYPGKLGQISYGLTVTHPNKLSVRALQDETRQALIEKYSALHDADYTAVVQALRHPFGGVELHNDFVRYTEDMDKMWNADILDVVPELRAEMVLLDERIDTGEAHNAEQVLREALPLVRDGAYRHALALYDRFLDADLPTGPNDWQIALLRAVVLGQLERWEESLAAFRRQLGVHPEMAVNLFDPSSPAVPDHYGEALATRLIIEELPAFRFLIAGLGYSLLNQEEKAQERFERAEAIDPEFVLASLARSELAKLV